MKLKGASGQGAGDMSLPVCSREGQGAHDAGCAVLLGKCVLNLINMYHNFLSPVQMGALLQFRRTFILS